MATGIVRCLLRRRPVLLTLLLAASPLALENEAIASEPTTAAFGVSSLLIEDTACFNAVRSHSIRRCSFAECACRTQGTLFQRIAGGTPTGGPNLDAPRCEGSTRFYRSQLHVRPWRGSTENGPHIRPGGRWRRDSQSANVSLDSAAVGNSCRLAGTACCLELRSG